jgi:hypothetical protein
MAQVCLEVPPYSSFLLCLAPNASSQLRQTLSRMFTGDLLTLTFTQTFVLPQSSTQRIASPDPASRMLVADHGHDVLEHNTAYLESVASSSTPKEVNMKSTGFTTPGTSALRERLLVPGNRVCSLIHCNAVVSLQTSRSACTNSYNH